MDKMKGFLFYVEFLKEKKLQKQTLYRAIGANYIDPETKLISRKRYEIKTKQTVNSETWKVYFYPSPLKEGRDFFFDEAGKLWIKENLDLKLLKERKSRKSVVVVGKKPIYDNYSKRYLEILSSQVNKLQELVLNTESNKIVLAQLKLIEKFISTNSYFFPYRFILDSKHIFIDLKKAVNYDAGQLKNFFKYFIDTFDNNFEKIFSKPPQKVQIRIKDRLNDIFDT